MYLTYNQHNGSTRRVIKAQISSATHRRIIPWKAKHFGSRFTQVGLNQSGPSNVGAYRADPLRSGKSSCIKTVFQQVPVKDVPYFGVTQKVEKIVYK